MDIPKVHIVTNEQSGNKKESDTCSALENTSSITTEEQNKLDERWENVVQVLLDTDKDFEKKILYVSAGAIAIALTSLRPLHNSCICCKGLLWFGVGFCITSIIYAIYRILASIKTCHKEFAILRKQYKEGITDINQEEKRQDDVNRVSLKNNYVNFILFILGVTSLLIFIIVNF